MQRKLRSLSPSQVIFIGYALAGIGQLLYVFLPATSTLNPRDQANLAIWQSISLGAGLALSSPINNIVFASVAGISLGKRTSQFRSLIGSAHFISIVGISLIFVSVAIFNRDVFFVDIWFMPSLAISIFLQVLLSIQRAEFSGTENWRGLSFQLGFDGFIKLVITLGLVFLEANSFSSYMFAAVAAQLFSLTISRVLFGGEIGLVNDRSRIGKTFRLLIPLWFASLGSQLLLSFPPALASYIDPPDAVHIAALGGIMQILRIPASFSAVFTLPVTTEFARQFRLSNHYQCRKLVRQALLKLSSIWTLFALFVVCTLSLWAKDFLSYGSLFDLPIYLLVLIATMTIWIPFFLYGLALVSNGINELGYIWAISTLLILFGFRFIGTSVIQVLLTIQIVIVFATLLLALSLGKRLFRV